MKLDRASRTRFDRDGFLVLPGLFRPDEIHGLRRSFDGLQRAAQRLPGSCDHRGSRFVLAGDPGPDVRIQRVVWCGGAREELLALSRDSRLLLPASQLLRSREMDQLINQAHFKLPGDGVDFPWHQDSVHRRYGTEWTDPNGTGSYVQSVLAVDDITEENGPLRFIPGSHRYGHLDDSADEGLPARIRRLGKPVAPTVPAGSVILFGPYVWHGSRPNRSDRPRRVLINGYAYPGANSRVYPGAGSGVRVCAPAAAWRPSATA